MLSDRQRDRYQRQIVIPLIGEAGQEKLLASRVLVVGLGGLGSPAAYYLAAAGVGRLGLMDSDTVSESNLQRQILHGSSTLGVPKAQSAAGRLKDLNPDVEIEVLQTALTRDNVDGVVGRYDLVTACLDNLPSRYVLNDGCVRAGVPLVEAGVMRFGGLVTTIVPGKGPCYRCIFPEAQGGQAMDPATIGIVGATAGVVGAIQAMEALKLLLNIGEPLIGRMLLVDLLSGSFREVQVGRNPECPACGGVRDQIVP